MGGGFRTIVFVGFSRGLDLRYSVQGWARGKANKWMAASSVQKSRPQNFKGTWEVRIFIIAIRVTPRILACSPVILTAALGTLNPTP